MGASRARRASDLGCRSAHERGTETQSFSRARQPRCRGPKGGAPSGAPRRHVARRMARRRQRQQGRRGRGRTDPQGPRSASGRSSRHELDAAVAKLQAVADLAKPAGIAAEDLEGLLPAPPRRPSAAAASAAKTAAARARSRAWIERAEDRLSAASRNAAERQEHTTAVLGDALATMIRPARRDERSSGRRRPSLEAAPKAIERIVAARKRTTSPRRAPNAAIETVLRGFETRIAEITDWLAERPPAGPAARRRDQERRRRDPCRQAELDRTQVADAADVPPAPGARARAWPPADVLHSLRGEIARLASQPYAAARRRRIGRGRRLRGEIERCRPCFAGLATRDEVNALERALRGITAQVANARRPATLRRVSCPVEELEAEIGRVAEPS